MGQYMLMLEPSRVMCKLCCKTFNISNMGEAALVSHMKGEKPETSAATANTTHNSVS